MTAPPDFESVTSFRARCFRESPRHSRRSLARDSVSVYCIKACSLCLELSVSHPPQSSTCVLTAEFEPASLILPDFVFSFRALCHLLLRPPSSTYDLRPSPKLSTSSSLSRTARARALVGSALVYSSLFIVHSTALPSPSSSSALSDALASVSDLPRGS